MDGYTIGFNILSGITGAVIGGAGTVLVVRRGLVAEETCKVCKGSLEGKIDGLHDKQDKMDTKVDTIGTKIDTIAGYLKAKGLNGG